MCMAHRLNIGYTAHNKYSAGFYGEHIKPTSLPAIAQAKGLRDGEAGTPDAHYLSQSDYRVDYIRGYSSGAIGRYSRRLDADWFDLFEQMHRPRDPHREPTIWLA